MAIMYTLTEDELTDLISAKQQIGMVAEVMAMVSGSPQIGIEGVMEFLTAQGDMLGRVLAEVEERGKIDPPAPAAPPVWPQPRKRERLARSAVQA